MPKNINNSNLALIRLIILFAVSLVMAGGGRPPEIYPKLGMVQLSSEERQMIDNAYLRSGDRGEIAKYQRSWAKFEPHPLLTRVFSAAQFYKLNSSITDPATSYLMSFSNGQFYTMPSGFNHLLIDNNLEVTDKNIIELAKAFVMIAFMDDPYIRYWEGEKYKISEVKEITFQEGKRINKRIKGEGPYQAMVRIRINDKIEEWYFDVNPLVAKGQLQAVSILELSTGRFHHRYFPLIVPKEKPKEGGMDSPPRIKIDSVFGGVYKDTLQLYLIVSKNDTATGNSVRFFINGFPPESTNVYVRARCIEPSYVKSFFFKERRLKQIVAIPLSGSLLIH